MSYLTRLVNSLLKSTSLKVLMSQTEMAGSPDWTGWMGLWSM
uniref:Uncharacterized protein n=1 Tax=Arcella intermedia TaxID=1963864 RepID=A0A6B2LRG1_9EUKA